MEASTCIAGTGLCTLQTPKLDGTVCDDGDDATSGDQCTAGVCSGLGAFISVQCCSCAALVPVSPTSTELDPT